MKRALSLLCSTDSHSFGVHFGIHFGSVPTSFLRWTFGVSLGPGLGVALVAIILACIHRTRKPTRWLPVVSLVVGFAQAGVLLWCHKLVASYAMQDLPVLLFISVLPIVISPVALSLSRRILGEKQPQHAEVTNEHQ